ncbi:hypothetical protein ACO2Q0_04755 [Phenylobacterium sp. VNQ135]|uniref:hypothetical protein n=1 Tax=Phenylobacterium sp. VNQ135 TaxID=3400922 RepID=UPI003C020682
MHRLTPKLALAAAAVLLLASCQKKAEEPQYSGLDMQELMVHVVDPAAFAFWRGSGFELTEEGERDLAPTTDEGWKVVEDGAATVAEAGNLLMLPGRGREPADEWNKYAKLLTERALEAKAAAEAKDKKAVFDTGGRLYEVCVACHEKYVIQPMLEAEKKAGK